LAQNVAARIIGLASQIVLARLLTPQDFGLIALASTVTAFGTVVVGFGIDDVLLQRQKNIRFWLTPALWTSLILGLVATVIILVAAPFAAKAYAAPDLRTILWIMAFSMPFAALGGVPAVSVRAALNFRLFAAIGTLELLVTQSLIIIFALNGFGAYSFALPMPLIAAARLATFWYLAPPKLGTPRLRQLRQIGSKGTLVFGTRVLANIVSQSDYFILGLLTTKTSVGVYYFAFRLAIQPVHMLAGNLTSVLFPALAQIRDNRIRQRAAAISCASTLSFIVMPYCFLQAAIADPLLRALFGTKWEAAVPLVQLLSLGLGFDAVSWVAGSLLSARGEFKRIFNYGCVFTPLFVAFVSAGALVGNALGVAAAVSLAYIVLGPAFSFLIFRAKGFSNRELINVYLLPVLLSIASIGLSRFFSFQIASGNILRILMTTSFGLLIYLMLVRTVAPSTLEHLIQRVRGFLAPVQN
jgi:PST family polysaccharide transporter